MLINTNELARKFWNQMQTKDHTLFNFDPIAQILKPRDYLLETWIKEI